jgi:hypothetical protein
MLQITEQQAVASAHSGLHGVAQMANKTLAITSKLTIIVASAATSMVESGAMRHFWWQSTGGVDLDHAFRDRVVGRPHRYHRATRHPALPGANARVTSRGSPDAAMTVAGQGRGGSARSTSSGGKPGGASGSPAMRRTRARARRAGSLRRLHVGGQRDAVADAVGQRSEFRPGYGFA